MKSREPWKRTIKIIISLVTIGLQVVVFAYAWFSFYAERIKVYAEMDGYIQYGFFHKGHILTLFVYILLLIFVSRMYGGTKIGYYKLGEVIFSQCFATIAANFIMYFVICLLSMDLVPVVPLLQAVLLQCVASALWIAIASRIYAAIFKPREMLIVYGEYPIEDIVTKFMSRKDKYRIKASVNISEGFERVCEECTNHYDAVVLWDIPTTMRNKLLKFLYGRNMRVYMMPKIPDVLVRGSDQLHLFDSPLLLIREYNLSLDQRFVKRIIDIVCALILTVLTSPIMLVTAILIKCYDGGPIFYKQVRCTRNMKEFEIIKFRSMKKDAEKNTGAVLAGKNDPRITPIGRFIRKVRIDELPQLFNILAGDMSFIGPRPERPEIIKQYVEQMPEFVFRTKVKAGLAGYAQVYGKYNTTPLDKLKLDLFYIENYSVWLDIRLMLLTLKILLKPESTEGIDASQTTALKVKKEEIELTEK